MEFFALAFVVIGMLAILVLWSAAISIWNAWWATNVWAILVVPSLHWPALPMAAAIGFSFVFAIFRHGNTDDGTKEEDSNALKLWKAFAPSLVGAPLIWFVAKIVAHFVL